MNGSKQEFLGCSNYPLCDYTVKDTQVLKNPIRCRTCGGYMIKRVGPNGAFYECSNYPRCRETMNIGSRADSEDEMRAYRV